MAKALVLPKPANDNGTDCVISFGQRKVLRDLPTYLKAGKL